MRDKPIDPVLLNDWYVLAKATDLTTGTLLLCRLLGKDLVLWRSETGHLSAWEDRCPHRSVRLSLGNVVGETLVCSYHGMAYQAVTGRCVNVPAHPGYVPPKQACVQQYRVQERYGLIYVCLGEPDRDIPRFPEWEDPAYRCTVAGPYAMRANGLRAIENFLDVAHFPFIHTNILGVLENPVIEDYTVSIDDHGVYAKDICVWQPDPYGTGEGTQVSYDYWAMRPLTAYLRKNNPGGECLTLMYSVTPVEEDQCIAWMSIAMNYAPELSESEVIAFQDMITLQDLKNLESHSPQLLPLTSSIEFSVPSDRTSLAYRKWLKQLGLTYGVLEG
ncbi:MAG TPA: aromatic ring-hydroxylating dioxygenase subunit alpha [Synechococcales cyanobacterium M55_K2018_004]|nr:aromatic ring-hydroxylating dioxygenase subunit alpha [Synechococcales cyanobacterium M55_K2018_004]